VLKKPVQTDLELKAGRLKKRPEFLCVAKDGKKWVSDSVIVQYLPIATPRAQCGFTATKKIGNAVIRNRAKRRLRAAMDLLQTDKTLNPAHIVLIARNTTATCDWDKLVKDTKWCLKRLEALSPKPV
jgi:ribonuclease P protein component